MEVNHEDDKDTHHGHATMQSGNRSRHAIVITFIAMIGFMSMIMMMEDTMITNEQIPSPSLREAKVPKTPNETIIRYCTSGNEYLSIDAGGRWVKQSTYIQTPPPNETIDGISPTYLCYTRGYKEYYRWSPPCKPRLESIDIPVSNGDNYYSLTNSSSSTIVASTKTTTTAGPKVLLIGDSLTKQIFASCQFRSNFNNNNNNNNEWNMIGSSCKWNHVEYIYEKMFIFVLDSIPYQSQYAPNCANMVMTDPSKYFLDYISEADFQHLFHGMDYIFFNQFAHWAKVIRKGFTDCYVQSNVSKHDMMEDLLQFFELQISRMSELMYQLVVVTDNNSNNNNNDNNNNNNNSNNNNQNKITGSTTTTTTTTTTTGSTTSYPRFYYRTSSPHAFQWQPRNEPLLQVPIPQTRNECTYEQGKYLWKCADTFNEISISAFIANGHHILNTAPVMNLRVDAHPCSVMINQKQKDGKNITSKDIEHEDCLHFCVPGTPDTMLQAIQTEVLGRELDRM